MKTFLTIVFSFIILTNICFAQWFWQNPLPQGNTLNDIDFCDNSFGLAVGSISTILKTTDGGLTWSLKESNRSENFYKIDVVNNYIAYIIGYNSIIKTTDGGENWFTITNPSNYLIDVFFIDELKGYGIGSGGTIFYTSDGGTNWSNRYNGISTIFKSIHFINEERGMAVGYNLSTEDCIIIKTIDSGITWTNYSIHLPGSYTLNGVHLVNELKAFVISSNGDLGSSTDGGENWVWSNLGTNLFSIDFCDSLTGFISATNKIFRTTNGGLNWQATTVNLGNYISLLGISSPTDELTYAVGDFGRMIFSTDNGNTWEQKSDGPLISFRDVSFSNENYGIVIGDGILTTSDGGNNWIQTSSAFSLFSCTRPSLNLCFAAGGFNILKSTDKGFTWTHHPISDDNYFMTISFADTLNGMASAVLGPQGKIFRTFDGGENWQQISAIQNYYIYDICFVDSLTAYACSGETKVFKTNDGGYTWIMQNTGVTGTILYGIDFVNRQVGYTVGYPGKVIKTTNGGSNWQLLNPNLGNGLDFDQVHFLDENNGLVGGDIIAHTSDGGQTWEGFDLSSENMQAPYMVNDSIWYAVGLNGIILKTTTRGVIPVELYSFIATTSGREIILKWATATETNNRGFEVQRSEVRGQKSGWEKIGFVGGFGTTTEPRSYTFTDRDVTVGRYAYRLKQIDLDGTFTYSQEIEVNFTPPLKFALEQNYPNPFNPVTTIKYSVPMDGNVKLTVYNALGQQVAELVNKEVKAGNYEVEFSAEGGSVSGGDGKDLASGVYFYRITAGDFIQTKKMVLLK